jgi:hypothetical protein
MTALDRIVDLERYPLHDPDSQRWRDAVAHAREGLRSVGCARLDGFIRPEAQAALQREVDGIAPDAHYSGGAITPYFNADDPSLPADHPRRRFDEFSNGFVAMDRFPDDGQCLALYRSQAFQDFVVACLEEDALYTFDDPLAGVVANVMKDGQQLPWHFDTNEFIVSLMTRIPERGGTFEYCPDIRAPGDENYPGVQAVLDGDRDRVRELDLKAGDLQIFRGRFAMHRVTRAEGERHTVLFGYAKQPGFIGKVERTREVHGRVTQAHIDAEKDARGDGLDD